MANTQYRHRRTSNPTQAFVNPLEPGEISVNTANRQLVVGDANGATIGVPVPLLALRYFDVRAQYAAGDMVVQAGVVYRAKATVPPGAFDVSKWDMLVGAIDPAYLAKAGGTMTGVLTLSSDPITASLQATSKAYVDTAVVNKAQVYCADTPPAGAPDNSLWFESDSGQTFVKYNDGDSSQWVVSTPTPDMGSFVSRSGDAMTGQLKLVTPPVAANDAAAKAYVDGAVRWDSAQTLTAGQIIQARQNIYAAPFDALDNGMQINGSMDVSQELGTTGVVLAPGAIKYIVDGWVGVLLGPNGAFNGVQSAITSLAGFPYCLTFTCTTASPLSGAGDAQYVYQPIEGTRWARLAFGAASAQPVTIGFWVLPPISGTMAVSVRNTAGNRSYVVDVPVTAGSWQYKTVTVPGDVTGTWPTGAGGGAAIAFCFGAGTTFKAPAANTWYGVNYIATPATTNFFAATGTAYLTGVVVLPGTEAPSAARSPLIMRPYDQELTVCRRYLWKRYLATTIQNLGTLQAYSATLAAGNLFQINPEMRAAPTITISSTAHFFANTSGGGVVAASSLAFGSRSDDVYLGTSTFATGLVSGNAAIFYSNASGAFIMMDARL